MDPVIQAVRSDCLYLQKLLGGLNYSHCSYLVSRGFVCALFHHCFGFYHYFCIWVSPRLLLVTA